MQNGVTTYVTGASAAARRCAGVAGALLFGLGGSAGCDAFSFVLDNVSFRSDTVTLRLVNETDFPVEPSVFVSSIEDTVFEGITEALLTLGVNEQDFDDLAAGESVSRDYDCDDFGAVMASEAELQSGIGISPDDDSSIFVKEEDFDCGDTVTIRYSGGLTSFRASISATSGFDVGNLVDLLANQ